MQKLKQGMAAIVLVVSLGLIVPSTVGGPVSADFSNNPNLNPDPFTLHCDLDGDSYADAEYDETLYEKRYDFQSTANSKVMFDPASNVSMTWRTRVDVMQAFYDAQTAVSPGYPEAFMDLTVEWAAGDPYPHGKPKGRKTVRCVNIAEPYPITHSLEEAGLDKEGQIEAGVPYLETDYQLYDVMLTGAGKAKAKSDQAPKAKKGGKHHGKGKRGR